MGLNGRKTLRMQINSIEFEGQKYIECPPDASVIRTEQDILDIIALAGEHDTQLVMFHQDNFTPDFFDLKTGLAGAVFQKCTNYSIKAVTVVDFDSIQSERFKELMSECNKGSQFHFYNDRSTAEKWLID